MNKRTLSQFFTPALIVSVLGLAVIASVYADTQDSFELTINVDSVAPSVGTPTDGGSSAATPTNVGTNVTFSTTGSDPNNDGYWLAICKTGGTITPDTGGGAPTCTAGAWCISSSAVASGVSNSCTYTAQQSDAMSNNWQAYVCDDFAGGSTCSSASTGDSPFHVNHPPVIGAVTIGPAYGSSASVDPGNDGTGAVYFRVAVSDPDSEEPQDTIDLFVCSGSTTSFNPATAVCSGGVVLCSATNVTTGTNAQCVSSNLVPIPTPHALGANANNVKIYLRDSSSTKLQDDGTNNNHTYEVSDVAPTVSNFVISQNPLFPSAGSSVNQSFTATLTDHNGYADIESAYGAIYVAPATLTGTGTCVTDSEINCYDTPSCSLSGGSGANVTVTCGAAGNLITTWFNIKPDANWKAHVSAVGGSVYSLQTEGTFTVNALSAIGVLEDGIYYNTLVPGGTSASQTVTLQNAGNIVIDALISGTNMTSGANTIPRGQQHWSTNASFTWGVSDYPLAENASVGYATDGCHDSTIAVTTDHTIFITSQIFWKLKIPASQAAGSYSGNNSFSATPNDCLTQ